MDHTPEYYTVTTKQYGQFQHIEKLVLNIHNRKLRNEGIQFCTHINWAFKLVKEEPKLAPQIRIVLFHLDTLSRYTWSYIKDKNLISVNQNAIRFGRILNLIQESFEKQYDQMLNGKHLRSVMEDLEKRISRI